MSNPGKLVTFGGKTMNMRQWALSLGIKPVTLKARLRKGMSLARALTPDSLALQHSGKGYRHVGSGENGGGEYEHRVIAEKALGKPLPLGALVHHVDGNPANNAHDNLVVCPNDAYHRLLHMRAEAYRQTGHYDWRRCTFCKQWDALANLTINTRNCAHHPKCHAAYHAELRRKKRLTLTTDQE